MKLQGPSIPPASGKVRKLVVFLHGLGADGNDLLSLSDEFAQDLPDTAFYSPNAPFPCDMAPYGYQWFSLQERVEDKILAGVKIAAPMLNGYLDELLAAHALKPADLALVGFSQGTMMALYIAARRFAPIAGVLGYSGALISPESLAKEAVSHPPLCLIHGDSDGVVPYGALLQAVDVLQQNTFKIEAHSRPGLGHGIDGEGIAIGAAFLKKCLLV